MAALDLKDNFTVTLYTYGQPRVGNQAFADYVFQSLPDSYIRVVHADDLVPHMPTRIFGFRHAGNEVWYSSAVHDGKFIECADEPGKLIENKMCSNSLWLTTSVKNHK